MWGDVVGLTATRAKYQSSRRCVLVWLLDCSFLAITLGLLLSGCKNLRQLHN